MANRIDVHSHFLPPDYLAAMRNAGIRDVDGYPLPQWTVESGLAAMDQNGIGAAVLSVSSPALGFVDGDAARELARSVSESARALITAHPDRFGAFALLPLPDVDASLREIAHALDTLGLDGVGVLTNYAGAYLGDRRFAPLFDELQRRKAVVFIHPTQPPGFAGLSLGLPAPVLEYPFDSTRAINSLILSGTLSRCPDVRFIVSHGGGTIPYLAPRFAPFMAAKPGEPPDLLGPGSKEIMGMLRRLYFRPHRVDPPRRPVGDAATDAREPIAARLRFSVHASGNNRSGDCKPGILRGSVVRRPAGDRKRQCPPAASKSRRAVTREAASRRIAKRRPRSASLGWGLIQIH
jgi:predicted TIM-barrel fold metal-dependent hydrolase